MLLQKIFRIRIPRLTENEFQATKFPSFPQVLEICGESLNFSRSMETLPTDVRHECMTLTALFSMEMHCSSSKFIACMTANSCPS